MFLELVYDYLPYQKLSSPSTPKSAGAPGRTRRPLELHLVAAVGAVRRGVTFDLGVQNPLVAVVTPVGSLRLLGGGVAAVRRLGGRLQEAFDSV